MAKARRLKSRKDASKTVRALLIEIPIYAALVAAYFFLVLHFLDEWIGRLSQQHRVLYSLVAIGLIIGQAVVLEWVTTWLMRFFRGGRSE